MLRELSLVLHGLLQLGYVLCFVLGKSLLRRLQVFVELLDLQLLRLFDVRCALELHLDATQLLGYFGQLVLSVVLVVLLGVVLRLGCLQCFNLMLHGSESFSNLLQPLSESLLHLVCLFELRLARYFWLNDVVAVDQPLHLDIVLGRGPEHRA